MNRIKKLFEERRSGLLSVFFTAGFPGLDDTVVIATELERAGVDMIEIGIPFSDPIADGPVIQESNKIALENGMSVKKLLDQVEAVRKRVTIPILLMGYLNPVLQFGMDKFCKHAAEVGVDGLILPDMPWREYQLEYKKYFVEHNLVSVFLISPTTSEARVREIDAETDAFIYAVSASSTTGTKADFSEEQELYFKRLQAMQLKNPFLIGFGVSSANTFEKVNRYASGAIVGSAFIRMLKEANDLSVAIPQFVNELKGR